MTHAYILMQSWLRSVVVFIYLPRKFIMVWKVIDQLPGLQSQAALASKDEFD